MNDTSAEENVYPIQLLILDKVLGSVNITVCLPLNAYVTMLILTGPRGTLASDFFSLNLAVAEILISLVTVCHFVFLSLTHSVFVMGSHMSIGFVFTSRPFFQCCICVDCYVAVVHPVLFLRYKPLRYRAACCCVGWLITLASCIYAGYTYSQLQFLYGFFAQNLLIFLVLFFCCLAVVRALKHPSPGENPTERRNSNKTKRRALNVVLFIMMMMAINFFFYVAFVPLQCCISAADFNFALHFCLGIAIVMGCAQPLQYLHRNGKLICFRGF